MINVTELSEDTEHSRMMLGRIYKTLTENFLAAGEDACCNGNDLLEMLSFINLMQDRLNRDHAE